MNDLEQSTPTRTDFMQAAQRCAAAYHRVRAELPSDPYYHDDLRNQHKAFLAFAAELPVLIDPSSFQLYIACIGQGASIGAIEPGEAGRFCHIAQTAMSAWKLANLIVPAAQARERAAPHKAQEQPFPSQDSFPASQNTQPVDKELQYALSRLPGWESQKQQFKLLRKRGISVPNDEELRQDPYAALYYCQTAEWFLRKDAEAKSASQPGGQADSQSRPQQPSKGEETATPLPPKGNQPEAQSRQAGAQSQPRQAPRGEEKSAPLPPKGNQAEGEALPYDDWESLYAATKLPPWETQVKLFNSLRERGINIPTDEELRKLPAQALRHCETARYFQSAAQPQSPQPANEQPPASKEPKAQAA